ncbi:MAG TPA: hypothetical protein VK501_18900 [Baekduia sp.]|uniref:hypothetical protein n=1 Tax=Baekduia sp. TaxID=2600305 RepID=UPI002C6E1F7C|nr:hypothetical protein [Baekduia sp.]HMJ35981.1 hypothetical protein [Baekduia sp.]
MLDAAHKLMLQAVAQGRAPAEPPPALRRLEATGLAVFVDGTWAVTEAGRVALASESDTGSDIKARITAWFTT